MQQTQRCKARTSRVDTVSRFPTCVLCCVHVPFPVNQIAEDINPTNRDYTMVKQFVYDKHIDHRALNLSFHLTGGRPNTSARAFRRHFEGEWGSFLGGFTDNMRTQIWREIIGNNNLPEYLFNRLPKKRRMPQHRNTQSCWPHPAMPSLGQSGSDLVGPGPCSDWACMPD